MERSVSHTRSEQCPVTYDALVLDAKLRQSLVTVRSLGQRGKRVAALEVEDLMEHARHVPAFSSRWCQQSYVAPSYKLSVEPFLDYLKLWLSNTGARVLIPSSDGTLVLLRDHREEIEQLGTRIAMAKDAALEAAVDKDRTLEIAGRLGLNIPRGVKVTSVDQIAEAVREIGLPAVAKPIESWLWGEGSGENKQSAVRLICKLVTTADEAREAAEELLQHGGSFLLQQFLPGVREAVSLMYANGEVYARFAQWAKRTQPPLGGTSVFRQSIELPDDINDQAERLVREIDLEGYSEVEFRRGSDGKPYLMEINPRLSASVGIAVSAGVDFPYLLYQWANGEPIDHIADYRVGGWMRYLEGDLLTTMQTFTQRGRPGVTPPARALLEFFAAFFVPAEYDYVDKKDLLPLWTAVQEFGDRAWQRLEKELKKKNH